MRIAKRPKAPLGWFLLALLAASLATTPAIAQETAATAAAPTAEQQLAAVRELVLHASYRNALPAAVAYLGRTDLNASMRNAGLEVLAIVRLALRDEANARVTLGELYARDPQHRLSDPDVSPVVQSAFARARESARPAPVAMEHAPETLERRGSPSVLARVTEGLGAVHELRLQFRKVGDPRWTTVVMQLEGDQATARIPLESEDGDTYAVEYFLEALAPSSYVLGRSGGPDAPHAVEIPAYVAPVVVASGDGSQGGGPAGPADSGGDIASEPWLWIVVGLVVVGGAVGTGVGVAMTATGPEDGSLGNVALPLVRF